MIFHYTSIETLGLIFESGKIRFNRVDRVDDVREAQSVSGISFGKYFFVSCWTRKKAEQIPLWHCTPNMRGVRIELPERPFKLSMMNPPPGSGFIREGPVFSPHTFEEMFGAEHMILPVMIVPGQPYPESFAGPVVYVDDVEDVYRRSVSVDHRHDKMNIMIRNIPLLLRTKSVDWEYQAEYRFSLVILPSIALPSDGANLGDFSVHMANYVGRSLILGVDHGIQHYDLPLDPNLLKKVRITLGPFCEPEDRAKVEELVAKFASEAEITASSLTGKIRRPRR